jgi:hypothetical protein
LEWTRSNYQQLVERTLLAILEAPFRDFVSVFKYCYKREIWRFEVAGGESLVSDCILPVTRALFSFLSYETQLATEEHGKLAGGVIAIFIIFIALTVTLIPALVFDLFILPICLIARFLVGLFVSS